MQGRHAQQYRERAAAIVEFAVVLPFLLTILFGIMEYGWIFMIRQSLQNAAREGCRVAVLQTSTDGQINQRIQDMMAPTGLDSYTVTLSHADEDAGNCTEAVTVSVSYGEVSILGGWFGTEEYDLTGTCQMRKEGCSN